MNKRILIIASLCALLLLVLGLQPAVRAAPLAQLTVFPTPTPGPDGRILYIVQPGDTLWRISAITGVSIEQIRSLNQLGTDEVINPGDQLLIGLAGPAAATPATGPSATQTPARPTPSASPGWGVLCVLLYNDLNGDSLRQETEPSLPEGVISISNVSGSVSLTADSPAGGTSADAETPEEKGYVCFSELAPGRFNITVAIPVGYNETTELSRQLVLAAGETTLLSFGAQANTETAGQNAIIPVGPQKSPVLGIVGGLFLAGGIGLGVYGYLLRRGSGLKVK